MAADLLEGLVPDLVLSRPRSGEDGDQGGHEE